MRIIGLIGGSTWPSTIEYYKQINQQVSEKLGNYHSARIIINSVDFQDLMNFNKAEDWTGTEEYLLSLAKDIENAGAECILLGANTLNKYARSMSSKLDIPIINIVEETAKEIDHANINKVGLLGTNYTMTDGFFQVIMNEYGIETLIPSEKERELIHHTIYEEFSKGIFTEDAKKAYINIIGSLIERGAQGIIMGCTEIPILLENIKFDVQILDTLQIHINAAVKFSLED